MVVFERPARVHDLRQKVSQAMRLSEAGCGPEAIERDQHRIHFAAFGVPLLILRSWAAVKIDDMTVPFRP